MMRLDLTFLCKRWYSSYMAYPNMSMFVSSRGKASGGMFRHRDVDPECIRAHRNLRQVPVAVTLTRCMEIEESVK